MIWPLALAWDFRHGLTPLWNYSPPRPKYHHLELHETVSDRRPGVQSERGRRTPGFSALERLDAVLWLGFWAGRKGRAPKCGRRPESPVQLDSPRLAACDWCQAATEDRPDEP